jgi:hypothetical protein
MTPTVLLEPRCTPRSVLQQSRCYWPCRYGMKCRVCVGQSAVGVEGVAGDGTKTVVLLTAGLLTALGLHTHRNTSTS